MPPINRTRLYKQLEFHEGRRNKPYRDSVGKLTIGVGRNLDDVGLSDEEINTLLINDVNNAERAADIFFEDLEHLDEVRQRVVVDMCFNMGLTTLMRFKKFHAALDRGLFELAAEEMLDSLWARQTKTRARRLAHMMKTGRDSEDF